MSVTTKRAPRVSPNMLFVLEGLCAGKDANHGCYGRSEYGARLQTLDALQDRGLIDRDNRPTDAGRALMAKRAA